MATYMYAYRIISLTKGRGLQSRLLDKDMPIATFLEFNLSIGWLIEDVPKVLETMR